MKNNIIREKLSDELLYLYNTGKLYHAYRSFGAHLVDDGVQFTVWAPGVKSVMVTGDFNGWNPGEADTLEQIGNTGVYTGFIQNASEGDKYKFEIVPESGSRHGKWGFYSEFPPGAGDEEGL